MLLDWLALEVRVIECHSEGATGIDDHGEGRIIIDIFGFHSCDEVRVGSFGSENLLEFAVTRVQNQFLGPSEVLQVEVFRRKTLIEPVRCANGLSFHLSVRVKEVER